MPQTLIAAASEDAAKAGRAIADAGGNAVDAAIASALVSMTTELGIVSPGASGFVSIWGPDDNPIVIDGYAEMPGRGLPTDHNSVSDKVFMEYGGGIETIVGWGSIAVPGAFAGFQRASEMAGRAPWAELLAPSVDLARHGFKVSSASGYYLGYSHDAVYGWDEEASTTYHRDDGSPVVAGDTVRIGSLASTLEALGDEGADLLYRGELGAGLVSACQERGGLITQRDLDEYEPIVRDAARISLHGWDIATNAPPAVGGITVAALLNLLERLEVSGWTAEDVAKYAAAQHAVFSFRRSDLDGDTDRFAGAAEMLALADTANLAAMHRSPSTVHVSAVDVTGLSCAVTISAGYGSGAVIPGTGFGLNNSLGEIELTSEGLHALETGQRLLSNMAPTVARSPEGQCLAIGSPGADRITSAICTVLLNHVVCGMTLEDAVAAPRLHAEVFEGVPTLAVEPGVDVSQVHDLAVRTLPENSMYFGGVQVASLKSDGTLEGAADPRRTGAVMVGGR
jgi:gamma-glutamyltranspeptidase/glutathione hydrolase